MSNGKARVLLVDDHTLYREGLRGLIEHWDEFEVVGEIENGKLAVDYCRHHGVDLILMDIQMPVMDGVEAAGLIFKENPEIAIVMLTVSSDVGYLVESVKNGARGYILKNTHAKELRARMNGVLKGEIALSPEAAACVFDLLKTRDISKDDSYEKREAQKCLTDHERLILRYVAFGETNKEIGARVHLGESAIKKQLSNIMFKLGLENRVQAAAFAIRAGLAD